MVYVIVFALLLGVAFLVSRPLLNPQRNHVPAPDVRGQSPGRIDLEAARDAKLREIRDAELDHQTGKLSDDDYAEVESTLRGQAIEILNRLDELAEPDVED